jgi:hypothetical protein
MRSAERHPIDQNRIGVEHARPIRRL